MTHRYARQLTVLGTLLVMALFLSALLPSATYAKPFGGQVQSISGCIREEGSIGTDRILVVLGPPRGGAYVWTLTTKTYTNGPPSHTGQWLLGLAGVPYSCITSISPTVTESARYMIMVGSSK